MATVTINRSDRFPVATSVGAYAAENRVFGGKPSGAAVETQTVASDGSLAFTSLVADTEYHAYAEVAGVHRYLRISDSTYSEPGTLAERLTARAAIVNA